MGRLESGCGANRAGARLTVYWFVVLPLKGSGNGGGFHPAMVPIHIGFHVVFGIGTAIIFRALAR